MGDRWLDDAARLIATGVSRRTVLLGPIVAAIGGCISILDRGATAHPRCGSLEQRCCMPRAECFDGLVCILESHGPTGRCFPSLPPPPPPRP